MAHVAELEPCSLFPLPNPGGRWERKAQGPSELGRPKQTSRCARVGAAVRVLVVGARVGRVLMSDTEAVQNGCRGLGLWVQGGRLTRNIGIQTVLVHMVHPGSDIAF